MEDEILKRVTDANNSIIEMNKNSIEVYKTMINSMADVYSKTMTRVTKMLCATVVIVTFIVAIMFCSFTFSYFFGTYNTPEYNNENTNVNTNHNVNNNINND